MTCRPNTNAAWIQATQRYGNRQPVASPTIPENMLPTAAPTFADAPMLAATKDRWDWEKRSPQSEYNTGKHPPMPGEREERIPFAMSLGEDETRPNKNINTQVSYT